MGLTDETPPEGTQADWMILMVRVDYIQIESRWFVFAAARLLLLLFEARERVAISCWWCSDH